MEKVDFGLVVPGRIMEEDLKITNKGKESVVVKILCLCTNDEFLEHDEYVYSVRKTTNYDYNEKYFVLLPPFSAMSLKVALKVPNFYKKINIKGFVEISAKNFSGKIKVPVTSFNHIPRITCSKELHSTAHGFNIIRLAHKQGKKQEFKIPFKNNSPKPVTIDLGFYEDEKDTSKSFMKPFEFFCHPTSTILPGNGQGLIRVIVNPSDTYGLQ